MSDRFDDSAWDAVPHGILQLHHPFQVPVRYVLTRLPIAPKSSIEARAPSSIDGPAAQCRAHRPTTCDVAACMPHAARCMWHVLHVACCIACCMLHCMLHCSSGRRTRSCSRCRCCRPPTSPPQLCEPPAHICTGTGLTPATSAPGPGPPAATSAPGLIPASAVRTTHSLPAQSL